YHCPSFAARPRGGFAFCDTIVPGKMTKPKAQGRGLRLIAAFKLLKGLALLALGIGALKLLHKDVEAIIVHWISVFQVDPHSHYLQLLLEKLSILDDRRLKELSVGTFIYSAIFLTEGAGLDRKSTRLNSSHVSISYAVFCSKKKTHSATTLTRRSNASPPRA